MRKTKAKKIREIRKLKIFESISKERGQQRVREREEEKERER